VEQLGERKRPPVVTMPMHSLLSAAAYLDQFCLSVSCAVVSSPRQAFLSRPRTTDPIPAASQLESTLSVGGPAPGASSHALTSGRNVGGSPRVLPSRRSALRLLLPARAIGRLFIPRDIGGQILDDWLSMSNRRLRRCRPDWVPLRPSGACSEGDYRNADTCRPHDTLPSFPLHPR
jgi:hypothetical protein